MIPYENVCFSTRTKLIRIFIFQEINRRHEISRLRLFRLLIPQGINAIISDCSRCSLSYASFSRLPKSTPCGKLRLNPSFFQSRCTIDLAISISPRILCRLALGTTVSIFASSESLYRPKYPLVHDSYGQERSPSVRTPVRSRVSPKIN